MGIGSSTRKIPNLRELEKPKGYFPQKLTREKPNFNTPKYHFIILNKNLYKLDTTTSKIEFIQVMISNECDILMYSNRRNFIISGGNENRRLFFRDFYYFDSHYPENPDLSLNHSLPAPL